MPDIYPYDESPTARYRYSEATLAASWVQLQRTAVRLDGPHIDGEDPLLALGAKLKEIQPTRRRHAPVLLATLLALVLVGGTAAIAFSHLAASGPQPDTVVPSSALGYLRIDLDPSVGQKLDAVRFLQKLPSSVGDLTDPRQALFTTLTSQLDLSAGAVNYATDVAPWLGNRMALAVIPGSGATPISYLALAVTDQQRGQTGLQALLTKLGSDATVLMRNGYAIVCDPASADAIDTALKAGTLADNPTYSADMAALGDPGVASAWFDLGKAASLASSSTPAGSSTLAAASTVARGARLATALRFTPTAIELTGITRGAGLVGSATTSPGLAQLKRLPNNTAAALEINGAGTIAGSLWSALAPSVAAATGMSQPDLGSGSGATLADDLRTVLGSGATVALPAWTGSEPTHVGLVSLPTDVAKAKHIVTGLFASLGIDGPTVAADGGNLYVASDAAYAADLQRGGTLGSSSGFVNAMANPGAAQTGLYVNLHSLLAGHLSEVPAPWRDTVSSLEAVGMTASTSSDGGTFTLRITGT